MRRGQVMHQSRPTMVNYGLAVLAVVSLVIFVYSFRAFSRINQENAKDSVEKMKELLGSQVFVNPVNNRGEEIPFKLLEGQKIGGFLIHGEYDVKEPSWSGRSDVSVKKVPYSFYVTPTVSNPPFFISLPDIQNEGVSRDVYAVQLFEPDTHHIFEYILNGPSGCSQTVNGKPPLVLDVGANVGWFTTYSAIAGCRSIGVEPQPRMITLIETSIAINDYQSSIAGKLAGLDPEYDSVSKRAKVINNIVNTDTSQRLKIVYNTGSCWACSVVMPAAEGDQGNANEYIIPATRLDSVIKEDVLLMKVDIEGFEVRGIESAFESIRKYNVRNILVEWTPRRWQNLHSIDAGTTLLEQLSDLGYKVFHYDLRMEYPKTGLEFTELSPKIRLWEIPRSKLGHLQSVLLAAAYGEANLWISKDL